MGTSVTHVAATDRRPNVRNLPGIRTFQSPRFRLVVAVTIWLVAAFILAAFLVRQAANAEHGQYAIDFVVYYQAAADVAAGTTPYAPEMFTDPVPAQGALLYKYAPIFAQLLVPLTAFTFPIAAAMWLIVQGAAVFAGTWLAARLGGMPRTLEAFCWCGAATTLFLPNFDTLWKGNVSGILALLTAVALVGGASGGVGVVSAGLLNTTPVVMIPGALVAGRRVLVGLLVGVAAAVVSFAFAPAAWVDYVRVIPNLVSGPVFFETNLAPDIQVQLAVPSMTALATLTRIAAVATGIAAVLLSIVVARRADGWAAAVALGASATLILPSSTWYHYLAPLLPLALFAWPRARQRVRAVLLCGAAGVTLGLALLPLAVAGAFVMVGGTLLTVWPRQPEATG
jgi:hypothetical protein